MVKGVDVSNRVGTGKMWVWPWGGGRGHGEVEQPPAQGTSARSQVLLCSHGTSTASTWLRGELVRARDAVMCSGFPSLGHQRRLQCITQAVTLQVLRARGTGSGGRCPSGPWSPGLVTQLVKPQALRTLQACARGIFWEQLRSSLLARAYN